jgi:hypothetical protein
VVAGNRVNAKDALVQTIPPSRASTYGSSTVRYKDVERGVVANNGVTTSHSHQPGQIELVGRKPEESPVKPDSKTDADPAKTVTAVLRTRGWGTFSPSPELRRLAAIEQPEPADVLPRCSQLTCHFISNEPTDGIAGDEVGASRLTIPYLGMHFFDEALDGLRAIDDLSEAPCRETVNFKVLAERACD